MPDNLLTCQESIDYLSDYLEGRLPAGESARLDEHMARCPECVRYLDSFRATIQACHALRTPAGELPPLPEKLVEGILAARRG
jgi:anti-sigma factor RsiW